MPREIWWTPIREFNTLETLNSLRLRQHGSLFPDNILKCILLTENEWILIKISPKPVAKGSIRRQAIIWTNDG